jgi:hypothetical protein
METEPQRTGVLVVRVWIEAGDGGLRARLTGTHDVAQGEETTETAATVDDVVAIVRSWVESFAARA